MENLEIMETQTENIMDDVVAIVSAEIVNVPKSSKTGYIVAALIVAGSVAAFAWFRNKKNKIVVEHDETIYDYDPEEEEVQEIEEIENEKE